MTNIIIAVDAMGGDHGPSVTVPAALRALAENSQLNLILVGDRLLLEAALEAVPQAAEYRSRLTICNATQLVRMDESPAHALRNKKDSSMRVAINLIQEGRAQACVSAGNTGALMAIARFVLKMLPSIDRPAIVFPLPNSKGGHTYLLDLGANVDCTADHLFQFAIMGSVLVTAIENKPNPRVALLNVGAEAIKGTDQVKQAAELLATTKDVNFIGYVEGNDIYSGLADVIVCDGFVGNVALKTSEGLARLMVNIAITEFNRNWLTKLAGFAAKSVLKNLLKRFNTNNYNGGSLLGLQGVVIKSHGGASIEAFTSAIKVAAKEVEKQVPEQIRNSIGIKMEGCEVV